MVIGRATTCTMLAAPLVALALLLPGPIGADPVPLAAEEWSARIRAGWLGKVSAGSGAIPTELWHKDMIRAKYGELTAPPQPPNSRGPLDDTTLAVLGWQAARERGAGFTSADIAAEWTEHLTEADLQGGGFGQEFLSALARLRQGEAPPIRSGSPRVEWIAGQMRAEIWGMLAPGDPQRAADYAARDASIINTGSGVDAARFVAALASRLMVDADIDGAVRTARACVPADSPLARLIDDTIAWHAESPGDWEAAWQRLAEAYRDRSLEREFETWSGEWLVETGGWPDAEVLDEYLGRRGVLRTHPFSETEPARLSTEIHVPEDGGSIGPRVACNDHPPDVDWLLRVRIGDVASEARIGWTEGRPQWHEMRLDLAPWAGRDVTIVLENALLGRFAWEAGFWLVPEVRDSRGNALHGRRPQGRPYRYPLSFEPMVLPETFAVLTGLLHGAGDFARSVSIATMCGFDTDCNAGTVGCLLGLRNGLDGIPAAWKDPIGDDYDLQVSGLPRHWSIADLARAIAETGAALAAGEASPPDGAATGGGGRVPREPPEGFGAGARGGEGGRVVTVTTLADAGPGSLREALAATGPRIVQFAVDGTIELETRLRCESGRITVDGGSAPGQGITLRNHGIQFRGDCDDIIVRDLRIRVLTGGAEGDGLLFWGNEGGTVERVLVDHCSIVWATDELVNTWGSVRDVTVQWSILAEAQLPHSKGWLSGVGSDRVTIHHCLFAQNADRNPKLEGGTYDLVNNVVYNWGHNNAAKIESGARANLVGNCFIAGPDSTEAEGWVFLQGPELGTRVYLEGNVAPPASLGSGDQWAGTAYYEQVEGRWRGQRPAPDSFRAGQPFAAAAVVSQSAADAYQIVLARAGARARDADDLRVIEDVRARTGHVGRHGG